MHKETQNLPIEALSNIEISNDFGNCLDDSIFNSMPSVEIDRFFDDMEINCTEISGNETQQLHGIKNMGNTCFLTVIFQMLWHFCSFQESCRKFHIPENDKFLHIILNIFHDMELGNDINIKPLMIYMDSNRIINYKYGKQTDCAEMLEYILNELKNVCNCDNFMFCVQNIQKCLTCNYIRETEEHFNVLRLQCARHFTNLTSIIIEEYGNLIEEINCASGIYHVNPCNVKVSRVLTHFPEILLIHLVRIDENGIISDKCNIQLLIDSGIFTNNCTSEYEYRLSSIICRTGKSYKKGHYVCYLRCGASWARCDDEKIEFIEKIINDETLRYAYIIGYELIKQ